MAVLGAKLPAGFQQQLAEGRTRYRGSGVRGG